MTQGIPYSDESSALETRQRRCVRSSLFRQVSQEALGEESSSEPLLKRLKSDGRGSPARCVSDFDKVTAASHPVEDAKEGSGSCSVSFDSIPLFRTPLEQTYDHHVASVRLEVELHPFRLIVSRLMSHTTLNKKAIFNFPVDPAALKLPDYHTIVKCPMDLGSIRTRLHSLEYSSREAVVRDIRLVFSNATTYNPPTNAVHMAAKALLEFFEEQMDAFVPDFEDSTFSSSSAPSLASPPNLTTRNTIPHNMLAPSSVVDAKKRKKRGSKKNLAHSCQWCKGRKCDICSQGCLSLEPPLLICNGAQCAGARIRKGAVYYIAPDGSRQYCERCHIGLPAVLPSAASDTTCRYKRNLLKRKNDEELVEQWLTCKECSSSVHKICAMFNEHSDSEADFVCGCCCSTSDAKLSRPVASPSENIYTYVSGATDPVPICQLASGSPLGRPWASEALPESCVSSFVQEKVRALLRSSDYPQADKTVTVRVISDCDRHFKVPEVVRNHFRVATAQDSDDEAQRPPSHVHYRSKAIALFQKIDGFDVCIFCMYVHEYDGDDVYEQERPGQPCAESKRVYIAYLDSVEHFRPRTMRTSVYHEILVAYLATARLRGYESANIWACPPSRGNSFVFWTYPSSQRTPTQERLTAWYHEALLKALDKGVMTDLKSLYESDFEPFASEEADDGMRCENICPTLLDGDFWVEEAVRLHAASVSRHLKSRSADGCIVATSADRTEGDVRCPALEVAAFMRDKIIADPVAFFFRKPVNAAALNLKDYHKIVTRPMDLGTIYARCMLGEYFTLKALVDDVELVVANAKKFNPPANIVHIKADELKEFFLKELTEMVKLWPLDDVPETDWTMAQDVSLRLDASFSSDSVSTASVVSGSVQSFGTDEGRSVSVSDMLAGGASVVEKRMAGGDTWLLEKKPTAPPGKGTNSSKKPQHRRRKSTCSSGSEPPSKRRRQSWLAEELCVSVRKLRTSFFSCSLKNPETTTAEEKERQNVFLEYTSDFNAELDDTVPPLSNLADARHALLEFAQFRNLQFDTLRRAKYSTSVLLYHLHNAQAPGVVACCSACGGHISEVRWHKVGKVTENRREPSFAAPVYLQRRCEPSEFLPEELCAPCFTSRTDQNDFIPIQVTCSQP